MPDAMPEHFIVYDSTANGRRVYMRLDEGGGCIWNPDSNRAIRLDKPVAALWMQMLMMQSPTSVFGMERAVMTQHQVKADAKGRIVRRRDDRLALRNAIARMLYVYHMHDTLGTKAPPMAWLNTWDQCQAADDAPTPSMQTALDRADNLITMARAVSVGDPFRDSPRGLDAEAAAHESAADATRPGMYDIAADQPERFRRAVVAACGDRDCAYPTCGCTTRAEAVRRAINQWNHIPAERENEQRQLQDFHDAIGVVIARFLNEGMHPDMIRSLLSNWETGDLQSRGSA
jgi:hypothetical protein